MVLEQRRMLGESIPLRGVTARLVETRVVPAQAGAEYGAFPPVDLSMTDDDVIVKLAVPGARQEDFSISGTGETATVRGEVRLEPLGGTGHAYLQEIWQGQFQRSFRLPIQVDADKADASYDHGILTVRLPRAEATKPRKIEIGSSQAVSGQPEQALDAHVQTERVGATTS